MTVLAVFSAGTRSVGEEQLRNGVGINHVGGVCRQPVQRAGERQQVQMVPKVRVPLHPWIAPATCVVSFVIFSVFNFCSLSAKGIPLFASRLRVICLHIVFSALFVLALYPLFQAFPGGGGGISYLPGTLLCPPQHGIKVFY